MTVYSWPTCPYSYGQGDAPTRFTYRTGESGVLASARVLPANIPAGGYDVSDVQVEIERPTTGVGRRAGSPVLDRSV